jgi:TonB family protein
MHYLVILVLCASAMAQQHKISVQKYEVPKYPAIARAAHVQGAVKLILDVASDGTVRNAEVLDGHPMLKEAALETAKLWRFHCDTCKHAEPFRHSFIIEFKIDDRTCGADYIHYSYSLPNKMTITRDATCPDHAPFTGGVEWRH